MIHKNTAAYLFLFMGMAIQCSENPFQFLVNKEVCTLQRISKNELLEKEFIPLSSKGFCVTPVADTFWLGRLNNGSTKIDLSIKGNTNQQELGYLKQHFLSFGSFGLGDLHKFLFLKLTPIKEGGEDVFIKISEEHLNELPRLMSESQGGSVRHPEKEMVQSTGVNLSGILASILPVAKIGGVVIGGTSLLLLLLHYYRK